LDRSLFNATVCKNILATSGEKKIGRGEKRNKQDGEKNDEI
jgi:hypothetical protein